MTKISMNKSNLPILNPLVTNYERYEPAEELSPLLKNPNTGTVNEAT